MEKCYHKRLHFDISENATMTQTCTKKDKDKYNLNGEMLPNKANTSNNNNKHVILHFDTSK